MLNWIKQESDNTDQDLNNRSKQTGTGVINIKKEIENNLDIIKKEDVKIRTEKESYLNSSLTKTTSEEKGYNVDITVGDVKIKCEKVNTSQYLNEESVSHSSDIIHASNSQPVDIDIKEHFPMVKNVEIPIEYDEYKSSLFKAHENIQISPKHVPGATSEHRMLETAIHTSKECKAIDRIKKTESTNKIFETTDKTNIYNENIPIEKDFIPSTSTKIVKYEPNGDTLTNDNQKNIQGKSINNTLCCNNTENEKFKGDLVTKQSPATHSSLDNSKIKNNRIYKFTCSVCQYKCSSKSTLEIHFRIHTGEKPFKCHLCNFVCAIKRTLVLHVKAKHTKEKNYSCDVCEHKFVTKKALNVHNRIHTGEKPYICDLCDYKSSQKGALDRHRKSMHTKEMDFACEFCDFKCVSKSSLTKHLRTHTGDKPYKCDYCDFRCSANSTLVNHRRAKHTLEKNFSCRICLKKFVSNTALNSHFRKHTGDKPFKCDFCDFSGTAKSSLIKHIRGKHTMEKNFSCNICSNKFVTKTDLNIHVRKHTGQHSYICDLCDYKSFYKANLVGHMQAKHTMKKNFSCPVCPNKYYSKTTLNKHVRKHTEK